MNSHKEGQSTDCGSGSRRSFCKARVPKGQEATISGTKDREAGPPVHRVSASIKTVPFDPCPSDVEAADDKGPQEQREGVAREDHVDLALQCTPRKQVCHEQARDFTSDFPSLVKVYS